MVSVMTMSACALHERPGTARQEFAHHLSGYVELRGEAIRRAGTINVTADARALQADVDAVAEMIQRLRAGERQGAFFSPRLAVDVRQTIAASYSGADRVDLLRAVADVQPEPFAARVNARYPSDQPRASNPPSVFAALPPLPSILAYRFVGRALLLLDRDTGVILDVLPDALPRSETASPVTIPR